MPETLLPPALPCERSIEIVEVVCHGEEDALEARSGLGEQSSHFLLGEQVGKIELGHIRFVPSARMLSGERDVHPATASERSAKAYFFLMRPSLRSQGT